MARRPTIRDVAQAAGLSQATVDRVLNGREQVREETARRVYEAARRIGYHAAPLIAQRLQAEVPTLRMGVVLHKEKQAFYQNFASEIEAAARRATGLRVRATIEFSTSQSPADFAALLLGMRGRVDAVAASAVTHPEVTDAVTTLREEGVPVFALLNDFAPGIRRNYLGLNNLKVGRIAASVIGMAAHRPGKVAVFVGGYRWHGHELREAGFRSWFREYGPQFQLLDTLVNLETRQLTYEATLDLLARHRELRGMYVAGGGMEGAIAALREARKPGEVCLVVNELTPESRSGLVDGFVTMAISTPLPQLCDDLVRLMAEALRTGPSDVAGQHFLRPELILPEAV
ncbi:Transcriptional regulator, LacI family [Rubellimicrobium mesophilum DSM 19309]|uniref:Transcriptional regulator, LacI family n=1 Tax=Rubellimicrobium mesophilum DSM 19309 TaxID=442562 RepID=A0A017HNZ6_9RHOB|nr:LacI family DNA-binding transcriptional regulator [Rubellimicrobium mesophilum]EYD75893.1 Transcriptional regulator, LacI family [Rubellimicrobium mesophilum DSM 19309]